MNAHNLKQLALPLALSVALGVAVYYLTSRRPSAVEGGSLGGLNSVPVLELPAKAAEMVSQATPKSRLRLVEEIVRQTVASEQAQTLPHLVGAVCREHPDLAAATVAAAVRFAPAQAQACLRAALQAAPQQTEPMVEAMADEFPTVYPMAAVIAAQMSPNRNPAILRAIGRAIPQLNPFVEQTLAESGNQPASMAVALERVEKLASESTVAKVAADGRASVEGAAARSQFPALEQFAQAEIKRAAMVAGDIPAVQPPKPADLKAAGEKGRGGGDGAP